jgi:diguanylate cyclase (GGDEF)-like protein/PAS domain S-box-containing protein
MNELSLMKVLIIDDNPLDLSLLTNMVRQSSELEVVAMGSSSEALRWCKSNEVDLVIVDCLMPAPNGLEFVYLFRKIRGNADIPIVMVTASEEREVKYQALEIGVNFFVRKPIDSIEFYVIINNAISMRLNQKRVYERERQLAESEEKFRLLTDKLPNMVAIIKKRKVIYANEKLVNTLGISKEDLYRKDIQETVKRFIAPTSMETVNSMVEMINAGADIIPQELQIVIPDGSLLNILVSVSWFQYGGQQAVMCIATDITKLKESERIIRESQRRLSTLINNLPGIAYRCKNDLNWTMEYISEGCIEILGCKPEEIINNAQLSYNDFIVERDKEKVWEAVQRAINSRLPYVIEYQITDKQGQVKWVWEKGTGVYDDKGQIIALEGFISDITERKMAEERFHYLAHYDSLTGLANRTLFFDRLHQAMRMAKRGGHLLALLFLDLDGFKFINDTYGHDAGDVVLKETAKRLLENVRESDTVARMGGDEFTVILPSIENKKGAAIVAQKIIRAISEPYAIFNEQCAMSASIGISIYYGGEEDTDTLIKKADIAMYRAKQSGKNCFAFYTA